MTDDLIGISISDSPDLQALGLSQHNLDQLISELVQQLIQQGAKIGYGGDLRAGGFTYNLFTKVAAQPNTAPRSFVHYLAFPVWHRQGAQSLFDHVQSLKDTGVVRVFLPDGSYSALIGGDQGIAIADGPLAPLTTNQGVSNASDLDPLWSLPGSLPQELLNCFAGQSSVGESLTKMRATMASEEDARIIIGGQVNGYKGDMPGIAEEALQTIEAGKVLIPITTFGGCASFIAHHLSIIPADKLLPQNSFGHNFDKAMQMIANSKNFFETTLERSNLQVVRDLVNVTEPAEIAKKVLRILS